MYEHSLIVYKAASSRSETLFEAAWRGSVLQPRAPFRDFNVQGRVQSIRAISQLVYVNKLCREKPPSEVPKYPRRGRRILKSGTLRTIYFQTTTTASRTTSTIEKAPPRLGYKTLPFTCASVHHLLTSKPKRSYESIVRH
jgi:hypothetical protein